MQWPRLTCDCGFVVASSTSALCRWINCGTVAIIFNGTLSGLTSASRLFCFCSNSLVLLVDLQCNNWNLQRYLPVLLKASYTPLVVDFEAVSVLFTAIIVACCFQDPLFRLVFRATFSAVLVIWLTPMMMIPIDYGAFVVGLQVRTSL